MKTGCDVIGSRGALTATRGRFGSHEDKVSSTRTPFRARNLVTRLRDSITQLWAAEVSALILSLTWCEHSGVATTTCIQQQRRWLLLLSSNTDCAATEEKLVRRRHTGPAVQYAAPLQGRGNAWPQNGLLPKIRSKASPLVPGVGCFLDTNASTKWPRHSVLVYMHLGCESAVTSGRYHLVTPQCAPYIIR